MRKLRLGLSMFRLGYHVAAWRHPDVQADGAMDLGFFANIARTAERGLFDLVFMADELAIRGGTKPEGAAERMANVAELEPLTLLSAIAALTDRIGLVSTVSTTYSEPYNLARQVLSLDHLSRGRAGWNVVTSWGAEDALNFGHASLPGYDQRYARAGEFVQVVRGLWNSWAPQGLVRDKASGQFSDFAHLHPVNHAGPFFKVRGPLNMAPSVQGEPVIFSAGDSDDGREIAAREADVVFTAKQDIASARAFYADIKARAARHGRDPSEVLVMPGLMAITAPTRAQADARLAELQALLDPLVGLASLFDRLGDLSGHDVDGPVPEPKDPAFRSRAQVMYDLAQARGYSIRQLYELMAVGRGHRMLVGTPADIADEMQLWFETGAADGFNMIPTHLPAGIDALVDLVVPELQRRGLFRTGYESTTLRGNLGLPMRGRAAGR